MSILIKGMEMPTVRDTLVLVKTNGKAIVYEDKAYATTAIPVRPHGRLIDKDAVAANLIDGPHEYDEWCDWALDQYMEAPTVIPADLADKEGEG